jgi:hypothetical protein
MSSAVTYVCRCGRASPLADLYYCTPCRALACSHPACTAEDIEAFYCPHGLDNALPTEVAMYQTRCGGRRTPRADPSAPLT